MSAYWWGFFTLPMLATAGFLLFVNYVRVVMWLSHRGVTFSMRWKREAPVSEYVLRNNIWWERSLGPAFAGGWYREPPRYHEPTRRLINRWVGLGSTEGPCVCVFLARDLGPAPVVARPAPQTEGERDHETD